MKDYLVVICIALGLVMGLMGGLAITDTEVIEVPGETILFEVPGNCSNSQLDYLYNQASEEDEFERLAKASVFDELDSRSFKKDLFDVLSNKTSIEDYKDITKIRVLDSEFTFNVNAETATATLEIKVYYFLDGDDEEDEEARYIVYFELEDLIEDVEVDYEFTFDKIYE